MYYFNVLTNFNVQRLCRKIVVDIKHVISDSFVKYLNLWRQTQLTSNKIYILILTSV